jgi:hypothetical protein
VTIGSTFCVSKLARRRLLGIILLLSSLVLAGCGGTTVVSEVRASPQAPAPSATVVEATVGATRAMTSTPEPSEPPPSPTATPEPTTQIATLLATDVQPPTEVPPAQPTEAPTAKPTPTSPPPKPSSTPTPPPEPAESGGPEIEFFRVTPDEVRNVGDSVLLEWEATGERAELCMTDCFGPTYCQEVATSGEMTYVTDETSPSYNGFALRISAGGERTTRPRRVRFLCENLRSWFFDPPPASCPASEPSYSYAAGQHFEQGFMIWVEETDEFYVFVNEPDESGRRYFHSTQALELKPGASQDNRVGEGPPPGLHEPVSGFGLIWRGEAEWPEVGDVRERLGWASEPEFGFDTAHQYETLACPRSWSAYLRGPHGEILRLSPASTVGLRYTWEQVQP